MRFDGGGLHSPTPREDLHHRPLVSDLGPSDLRPQTSALRSLGSPWCSRFRSSSVLFVLSHAHRELPEAEHFLLITPRRQTTEVRQDRGKNSSNLRPKIKTANRVVRLRPVRGYSVTKHDVSAAILEKPCDDKKAKIIEVGTPVARRPPHRSRRAVFPHRAPQGCSLGTRVQLEKANHNWMSGSWPYGVSVILGPGTAKSTKHADNPFQV